MPLRPPSFRLISLDSPTNRWGFSARNSECGIWSNEMQSVELWKKTALEKALKNSCPPIGSHIHLLVSWHYDIHDNGWSFFTFASFCRSAQLLKWWFTTLVEPGMFVANWPDMAPNLSWNFANGLWNFVDAPLKGNTFCGSRMQYRNHLHLT